MAQVQIRRLGVGFELRHVADAEADPPVVTLEELEELRALAQVTADGQFRPLRAAPTLRSGWRFVARNENELWEGLDRIYPGAVADWFAARQPVVPVTHYREFTARQSGMYRVTTLLSDADVAWVAGACCHPRLCLKQRLWTVEGLAPDGLETKSSIPCLEPCAVLMELARKAVRLAQDKADPVALAPGEWATLRAALSSVVDSPALGREADLENPLNRRRVMLLLARLPGDKSEVQRNSSTESEGK